MQRVQEAPLCLVASQVQFDAAIYHLSVRKKTGVACVRDAQHEAHSLGVLRTVDINLHTASLVEVLNALAVDEFGLGAEMANVV